MPEEVLAEQELLNASSVEVEPGHQPVELRGSVAKGSKPAVMHPPIGPGQVAW